MRIDARSARAMVLGIYQVMKASNNGITEAEDVALDSETVN